LNQVVWTAIREAILNPRLFETQIQKLHQSQERMRSRLQTEAQGLEASLEALKTEEARVLEAYRKGILSAVLLAGELDKLEARRSFLLSRRPSLGPQNGQLPPETIRRSIQDYTRTAAERIDAFSFAEQQRFLRLLIMSVVFEGIRVRIRGAIPISQNRDTASELGVGHYSATNRAKVDVGSGSNAATSLGDDGHNLWSSAATSPLVFELTASTPLPRRPFQTAFTHSAVASAASCWKKSR